MMHKFLSIASKFTAKGPNKLDEDNKTEIKEAIWSDLDFIKYCNKTTSWPESDHDKLKIILDIPKNDNGYYKDIYGQRISYNGIRTLRKPNTEIDLSQIHQNEIDKCASDFKYFRKHYCLITTKNGLARPEPRPYQEELEDELLTLDDTVILYPRQSGKTVTSGTYLLWLGLFHLNAINIGIVANKPKTAREVLDKIKKIFLELPIWMKTGIEVWNKSEIEFENGTRIMTDGPSSDSFRGYTCVSGDTNIEVIKKETGQEEIITMKELYERFNNITFTKSPKLNYSMIFMHNYMIKTERGYEDFETIRKVQKNKIYYIKTETSFLRCTEDHKLQTGTSKSGKIFRQAKKLKIGHKLSTGKIIDIQSKEGIFDFYDIVGVKGQTYTTNNIESHNCNIIYVDETAYIKKSLWDEFVDSVMPTMNSLIFKQVIMTSTANGMNHFEKIVKASKRKDTPERFITCDWKKVPHYSKAGELIKPADYKKQVIKKYGKKYFAQTEECAFLGSSDTLISGESLREVENNLPKTIPNNVLVDLEMFHKVQEGHSYILSCDPSKDGIDDFSIDVLDVTTFPFIQVATANLQVDYIIMPEHLFELGNYYNEALIIVENNEGAGQSITDTLWGVYEYPNLYRDNNIEGRKGKKKFTGFRTTVKTRPLILNLMKIFIEEGKLVINSETTLTQLYTFTKRKTGNKYEAEDGYKDDAVMSLAIAFAPFMDNKTFDDYEIFMKELRKAESEVQTGEFLSMLDLGFSSDDDDIDLAKKMFQEELKNDDLQGFSSFEDIITL